MNKVLQLTPSGLYCSDADFYIDPLTADAVLIYAQRGHGKRAGLYTDYTFAVWQGDKLVPFAKAYSGLNNEEIQRVDRFVQRNTLERFGPVRSVRPELVFEIAFEGIQPPRGTSPVWPCDFRGSPAGEPTSPLKRPTRSKRSKH